MGRVVAGLQFGTSCSLCCRSGEWPLGVCGRVLSSVFHEKCIVQVEILGLSTWSVTRVSLLGSES